jgi:hypothetical protein
MADRLEPNDDYYGQFLEVLHQEGTSWRERVRTAVSVLGWITFALVGLALAIWVAGVVLGVIR